MLKHTQSTVQVIKQLSESLKEEGLLTNAKITDEAIKARLFDMLGDTGFATNEPRSRIVTILISDIRGFSSLVESLEAKDVVG